MRRAPLLAAVILGFLLRSAAGSAQTTPVPGHQHYQKPAGYDQVAAPGMPVAPRLQNLGVHTFRVTTASDRAQLFVDRMWQHYQSDIYLAALEILLAVRGFQDDTLSMWAGQQ